MLTMQELNISQKISECKSNKEIAIELSISPKTLRHHINNIYHKTGWRNRVEIAINSLRRN